MGDILMIVIPLAVFLIFLLLFKVNNDALEELNEINIDATIPHVDDNDYHYQELSNLVGATPSEQEREFLMLMFLDWAGGLEYIFKGYVEETYSRDFLLRDIASGFNWFETKQGSLYWREKEKEYDQILKEYKENY